MNCPNCGTVCLENFRFCYECGMPLERTEKKGTHLVPLVMLMVLTVLGLCVYFATGGPPAAFLPDAPQGPVFTVTHGALFADSAFEGVPEITVPETVGGQQVSAIGRYCFADCPDLTAVHLPDSVRFIGEFAFVGCISLRAMDLPDAVEEIGSDAFRDCVSLEAIRIPASVRSIGPSAFRGCNSLSYVFFDGTVRRWNSLFSGELPAGTTVCCTDSTIPPSE